MHECLLRDERYLSSYLQSLGRLRLRIAGTSENKDLQHTTRSLQMSMPEACPVSDVDEQLQSAGPAGSWYHGRLGD